MRCRGRGSHAALASRRATIQKQQVREERKELATAYDRPRQRRYAQVGRFSANDRRAAVTSDGHPESGPQAVLW